MSLGSTLAFTDERRAAPEPKKPKRHRKGAPVSEWLRTEEVARETGATMRQLQWWDERGVICPSKRVSHCRWYSPDDVALVRRLMTLRTAGVSLQQARNLLTLDFLMVRVVKRASMIDGILYIPQTRPRKY